MPELDLTIIVVVYNMQREAPRTLYSLSRAYQKDIGKINYEVIVVDNGSDKPFSDSQLSQFGPEFRSYTVANPTCSPARGINEAATLAKGGLLGMIIDGARILTPGVLCHAVQASRLYEHPVIYTLGWHLGHKRQQDAINEGYNQSAEDALLKKIGWPDDGYRLFEIATQAGNSNNGWLFAPGESNCLFVQTADFHAIGGYNQAFDQLGGGLVNHDFYHHALALPGAVPIALIGEGSFHQIHGGITTNSNPAVVAKCLSDYTARYEQIRGKAFARPVFTPLLFGRVPASAARFLKHSVDLLCHG